MNYAPDFGKTQPIRIHAKRYEFRQGFVVRHITGPTWERIDLDGKLLAYMIAVEVEYENNLAAQWYKSRLEVVK